MIEIKSKNESEKIRKVAGGKDRDRFGIDLSSLLANLSLSIEFEGED